MGRSAMFAILLYFLVAFHFVSAGPLAQQDNVLAPNDHVLVQQHGDSVQRDDVLMLDHHGLVQQHGDSVQRDDVLMPDDHVLVQQHGDSVQLDDVLALEDNGLVLEEGPGDQNMSVRSGCPDISELPIVWDKQFLGVRIYHDKGNDIPALSCNGAAKDFVSGFQHSSDPGKGRPIGSIFVHPGCTFYGFHDWNYQGSYTEWTGPLFISNLPEWEFGFSCSGVACARSFLVDCRQHYPDCQAEDSWKTVTSLDNTQSDLPATFTYKYTIGTSWSHQMSDSMDISTSISEEVKAGFFDIFEASLGVSVTTGYNWSETSTAAKSETKEITDSIKVPGGRVITIQQAKGYCGGSEVNTEMFRNVATFKNGKQIIETINM